MPEEVHKEWAMLKLGARNSDERPSVEGTNQGDHCLLILSRTKPANEYFFREHDDTATYTQEEARHVCETTLKKVCGFKKKKAAAAAGSLLFDKEVAHDALCVRVYMLIKEHAPQKMLPLAVCLEGIETHMLPGRLVDQTWVHDH